MVASASNSKTQCPSGFCSAISAFLAASMPSSTAEGDDFGSSKT
jgi:hypothetical protein